MAYTIVIVAEKESAAGDIAKGLFSAKPKAVGRSYQGSLATGEEVAVTWLAGHMYELASPEAYNPSFKDWSTGYLPIAPPKWEFTQLKKSTAENAIRMAETVVRGLAGKGEVINACDAEREGELIFRKFIKPVRLPAAMRMSRMWIHSFTPAKLAEAFLKRRPHSEYNALGESAATRDEADWFWGMNMTRLVTRTVGPELLSVGRVQTPTLAMIVDRDKAIQEFKPAPFWEIAGEFPSGKAKADLTLFFNSPKKAAILGSPPPGTEDAKVFWDKAMAMRVCAAMKAATPYKVEEKNEIEIKSAPLPYSLPEIQKRANTAWGWSAADTLGHLQHLYEKGLASYPRTNSRGFPEAERDEVYAALEKVWPVFAPLGVRLGKLALPSKAVADKARAFDDSKVDDHYALRPTGETKGLASLPSEEMRLFLLMTQGVVCALDEPAHYAVKSRLYTSVASPNFRFTAKGRNLTKEGWRRWLATPAEDTEPLPPITGPQEPLLAADLVEKTTRSPESFNEASLLGAMEHAGRALGDPTLLAPDPSAPTTDELAAAIKERGIGTAATRHEVINKLESRKYIEKKGRKLYATEVGIKLITELRSRCPLATIPLQTADWEYDLDQMRTGAKDAPSRLQFLDALLAEFNKAKKLFPNELMGGAGGGGMMGPKVALALLCPLSKLPVEDCGKFLLFPGVTGMRFYKEVAGRQITPEEYAQVVESWSSGTPHLLDGFVSKKTGRPFTASLVVDPKERRLAFFFPPR